MKALNYRQLSLVSFIGAALALVLSFQACSGSGSSVRFASSEPTSSDSVGRGDGYDGKPETGTYYRVVPDLKCGGDKALYGSIEITASSVKMRRLDKTTCAPVETDLQVGQLEYSGYTRTVLGFEDGVFEKRDLVPDVSDRSNSLAEAWCRSSESTPTAGLDVVVHSIAATGKSDSKIVIGTTSNGRVYARTIVPQNMVRAVTGRKVQYTGSGFSLSFDLPDAGSMGVKVTGQLQALIDGQNVTRSLACRVAGALDVQAPVAPLTCPTGYISVPKLAGYTTSDFCVAKYESKANGTVAESRAADAPWVDIDRPSSLAACRGNGVQFDLISNSEWQSIARNIETVPANWSGGTIGSAAGLNRGHSDGTPNAALAASADDNQSCFGTGQNCDLATWSDQRRTHRLNNGNVLWDLSGNVIEWVKDDVLFDFGPRSRISVVTNNAPYAGNPKDLFGPGGDFSNLFADPYGGLGLFETGMGGALMRGGVWYWFVDAGVFQTTLTEPASSRQNQLGFRCAYHP